MSERTSPPIGAYHVHAFTASTEQGWWTATGQTWLTGRDGQATLLSQVSAGPHGSQQAALNQAYDRAYADTLRLLLREFVCL